MSVQLELKPWVSGYIDGSLALDFVVASAGIQLEGFIMKVELPVKASVTAKLLPLRIRYLSLSVGFIVF